MIELDKSTAAGKPEPVEDGDRDSSSRFPPLQLHPDAQPREAQRYEVDEFLRYHDRNFISYLYLAIHKRVPTIEELSSALDDLRSGRRTKIEIIESTLALQTDRRSPIQIAGLSSPTLRRISRWPIIGYLVRMFTGFTRLPVLIQHQQQFEAYTFGQQEKIAEYLNDVFIPAINWYEENSPAVANLTATLADAVDSVTMLSDSLIDLSARQAELQTNFQAQLDRLQTEQAQHGQQQAEMHAQVQTQLQIQAQTQAQLQAELNALLDRLRAVQAQQAQLTETQKRLQTDLSSVASTQTAQQHAIEELQSISEETRRTQASNANAQQEFLVQEQRAIVETQKVVLADLQSQIDDLLAEHERQGADLTAEVAKLKELLEKKTPDAAERATRKQVAKT